MLPIEVAQKRTRRKQNDHYKIILIMLYYTRALIWGSLFGIYYGERRLPYPIQYIPKGKKEIGDIKIDLSIFNSIYNDVLKIVPK